MNFLKRAVTALLVASLIWIGAALAQPLSQDAGVQAPIDYNARVSVTSATTLFQLPNGGYRSWTLQFTSAGSSNQFTCEASNDNSNWVGITAHNVNSTSLDPASVFSVATGNFYGGDLDGRFLRCRVSTYTSGTVTAYLRLSPYPSKNVTATLSNNTTGAIIGAVAGDVASATADSGKPVKTGCKYNSTPVTVTDGQRVDSQCSAKGFARVSLWDDGTSTATAVSSGWQDAFPVGNRLQVMNYPFLYSGNATNADREFTCANTAVVNVAPGTTQLVALSGSTVIRICSIGLTESLAGTAKFVYGTGANCGTGTTDITAAMVLATNEFMGLSAANGSLFRGLAANAVCLTSVTGTITGWISYTQF